MATKEKISSKLKPPPPSYLNKELLGIWCAWSHMGDVEMIREAVTKGSHIDLAHNFLSLRRGVDLTSVKDIFKDEALRWTGELLSRRQVFRAAHVLSNVGSDAIAEFTTIFSSTFDHDLRNYLGAHLEKLDKLDAALKSSWEFLKLLNDNYLRLRGLNENFDRLSVEMLHEKIFEWKCNVATELFFKIHDSILKPYVTSESAWKCLLKQGNSKLIEFWIKVYYTKRLDHNLPYLDPRTVDLLVELFSHLPITENLIDQLSSSAIDENFRTLLLNELSKFGIFISNEKTNILKIILRLCQTGEIVHLRDILNQNNSNVKFNDFNEMLIDFCVENSLYSILNWSNIDLKFHRDVVSRHDSKYLELLSYFGDIKNKPFEKKIFIENVVTMCRFFGRIEGANNIDAFLMQHSLILVALVLLFDSSKELFKTDLKVMENVTISTDVITKYVNNMPFLKSIVEHFNPEFTITYKDLLKAQNFVVDYEIKYANIPNFSLPQLVEKFGYKKKFGYTFFLGQGRPSFGAKMYTLTETQGRSYSYLENKLLKLISRNYLNKEVTSACVAFLEMIGMNSDRLRVYIKAINILHENLTNEKTEIIPLKNLLLRVNKCPDEFMKELETVMTESCLLVEDYEFTEIDLVTEIKKHELVVKFSRMHFLKLPCLFLEHCAKHNLWLPFLLFVQTFKYPLADVQRLSQAFCDDRLVEHLLHGVSHNLQIDGHRRLMGDRDSRKYYLSKIGVRQCVEAPFSSMHSAVSSYGSYGSTSGSSTGSVDFLDSENLDVKTDLLQILIRCHNSVDTLKALLQACYVYNYPLLAIFATSYEPDSIVTNWLMWLTVSCKIKSECFHYDNMHVTPGNISDLLVCALKTGYINTLHESFQIFFPNNPLIHFVDFLADCIHLNFDQTSAINKLSMFDDERKNSSRNETILNTDYELMLYNQTWIESTALKLLSVALQNNFISRYNQLRFLQFLIDLKINTFFTISLPNFRIFYDIFSHLLECTCNNKLDLSLIFDAEMVNKELNICIQRLLSDKHYSCSLRVAEILDISPDFIIINQWENNFENRKDKNFWTLCDEAFKSKCVSPDLVIKFFEQCLTKVVDLNEKYEILKTAFSWACQFELDCIHELGKKMWLAFFSIGSANDFVFDPKQIITQGGNKKLLYAEMKIMLQYLNSLESKEPLNDNKIKLLDKIIEILLTSGLLWQAVRLANLFDHQNSELNVILLGCELAEGLLKPNKLNSEQRLLVSNAAGNLRTLSCRRRRTFISSKSFYNLMGATLNVSDQDDVHIQDVLTFLEVLSGRAKCGAQIAQATFLTYRISANTQKSYQEVFNAKDSMKFIKEILCDDSCINKLEIVHDFSLLFNWTQNDVSNFLSEELINAINKHIGLKSNRVTLWNLNIDTDFHVTLQVLVKNCSELGLKLYLYASTLHKSETQSGKTEHSIDCIHLIIELLIRSHDCFTVDCNMEGISTVLRKSQQIVTLLHQLKNWKLMVRLLTGVARYTEMNYVFHILKENDQFEFLLCKGNSRDSHLKLALLKYLKKYCPENRELYRMVALHFTLFSEIAELWEEEGKSIIRNLIAISKLEMQNNGLQLDKQKYVLLTNTDGTKICLNRAMINYTHATEYHLQGKKLNKAASSAKQAELLALQISLMRSLEQNATTTCILKLEDSQILSLISTSDFSFPQSMIVIESYSYKVDWSIVLFEQYVVRNQTAYLTQFLTYFSMTDSLANDIMRKYLGLKTVSDASTKNMKEIVKKCTNTRTKYRISSELGFYDLVEDSLTGSQLAYLKDTAWKTGFKNAN